MQIATENIRRETKKTRAKKPPSQEKAPAYVLTEADKIWLAKPTVEKVCLVDIVLNEVGGEKRPKPLIVTEKAEKTVTVEDKPVVIPAHVHFGWAFGPHEVVNCHVYGVTKEEVMNGFVGKVAVKRKVHGGKKYIFLDITAAEPRTRTNIKLGRARDPRGPAIKIPGTDWFITFCPF